MVDTFTPVAWAQAIERLVNHFPVVSAQARVAGEIVRSEHSAQGLMRTVLA